MAEEPENAEIGEGEATPEIKADEKAEQPQDRPDDSPQTPSDVEELAREMGWRPKEEWKGDDTAWKDAKAFVKHTVDVNRTLSKDVKGLKDQVSRMARTSGKMLEKALSEQKAEIEARFEDAVAAGDVRGAKKARADLQKLEESDAPDDAISDFKDRNPWFDTDPDAAAYAYAVCERHKTLPPAQQLQKAEEAVRKRFPEHFGEEPKKERRQPAVHEPGSRSSSARPGGKTFNDLPADARAACLEYEKKGVKRADYVKTYFEENA